MSMIDRFLIIVAKLMSFISTQFGFGAGGTWPGEIALRMRPGITSFFLAQKPTVVLVAGTNGKTTTTKMIETILHEAGIAVHKNASGANLDNGIVSSFLSNAGWDGKLHATHFIFEVDEATLPWAVKALSPSIIVLLNLFRDQLDRYGEVDAIAEKWQRALSTFDSGNEAIKPYQPTLIIDSDDPHLAYIGSKSTLEAQYFGLDDPKYYLKTMQHATDTIYCPQCGSRLTFAGVYFSHLGKWRCDACKLSQPSVALVSRNVRSPMEGIYNIYNTLAATLTAKTLGIKKEVIQKGLAAFTPAFGRMEMIDVDGKQVRILLSKNPTGLNESLRAYSLSKQKGPMLIVLNDRIPDGRDVSWIWDVDFEEYTNAATNQNSKSTRIFVSGDRCYDMALRLKYAEVPIKGAYRNLEEAMKASLSEVRDTETLWVLPTYSAMLDVRNILTGRKIL